VTTEILVPLPIWENLLSQYLDETAKPDTPLLSVKQYYGFSNIRYLETGQPCVTFPTDQQALLFALRWP